MMRKHTTAAESAGLHRFHFRLQDRLRFKPILCRGAVAVLTAAALVLTGVIPERINLPGTEGLPPVVEAAGPSKGTITFYKYTLIEHAPDLPEKSFDGMLLYERGGNWFFPRKVTDINNSNKHWKTCSVDCDPRINPDAKEFFSRTKWSDLYLSYYTFEAKGDSFTGYRIYDDDWNQVSHTTEYLEWHKYGAGGTQFHPSEGHGNTDGMFIGAFVTGNANWVHLRKKAANSNNPERLDWDGYGGDIVYFKIYRITEVKYNCINADYTIGTESNPQTYIANGASGGLFLKEGVKLTIPAGSVLVVKNGSFYVNGTIDCYGTILVEDGGILTTYDSTSTGGQINLYEGSAMIVRGGGRAYAGCPAGSLGAAASGKLSVYPGASIINYGLLVAGRCDFSWKIRSGNTWRTGSAIVENHKGAAMYLGYAVEDEKKFLTAAYSGASASALGLVKTDGFLYLQAGDQKTIFKVWDGAKTEFANNSGTRSVKLYSYDKDGKCTTKTYTP